MSNINWVDGAVCFARGRQWEFSCHVKPYSLICCNNADLSLETLSSVIKFKDLQLNEMREGDYIKASEIDTEQKYNDAVEVFRLFGAKWGLESCTELSDLDEGDILIWSSTLDQGASWHIQRKRKITYPQLMAVGKLKRAMIERDEAQKIDHKNTWVNPKCATSNWSDEHYNHFYQLTKDDIEAGQIKVDAYFVNRMWKINSWDDSGAAFHIVKTLSRIANSKNPLKRELVALKKQVDILCKLHGISDEESSND